MDADSEKTRSQRAEDWKRRDFMIQLRRWIVIGLLIVLTVSGVVFFNSPFFAIEKIEINNEGAHVSASEIEAASGIAIGELVWRVDRKKAEEAIYLMPWIQTVTVERKLPNRIIITITEGEIAGYVTFSEGRMAIDNNAKTIALCDPAERITGCPVFTGVGIPMPTAGMPLTTEDGKIALIQMFLQNAPALPLVDTVILDDVKQVDMVLYSGLTVKLGSCDNLKYQLSAMEEVLKQISSNAQGILDLRMEDGRISYRRPEGMSQEEAPAEFPAAQETYDVLPTE